MPARSWPAGTASPEDCRFRHSSSFHHISSAFSLIVFSLKSLQPPQKSGWPLPVSQGQCTVGLLPLWVPCAVSEHHEPFTRVLAWTSSLWDASQTTWINARFARTDDAWTMFGAPGEVPHLRPPGAVTSCCLPERRRFVWGRAWGSLRVGGGAPSLYFRFLCQGFLLPLLLRCLPQLF